VVVLDERVGHAGGGERVGSVGLDEVAPRIRKNARLKQQYTRKRSFDDFQTGLWESRVRVGVQMCSRNDDYNPCFVRMLRCSAIIVTYNSGDTIEACLRALASERCEIVVVDNASRDDTVSRVQEMAKSIPISLVALPTNQGFAGGVNTGARKATGDVFLVLNPDAIAERGAVAALLNCLARSGAGAAGGALCDVDGRVAKGFSFRRLPTLGSLLFEALLVNQLWPENAVNRRYRCLDADYSAEQEIEQPAGACLAVTRAVWEKLGGMDERFFPVWFEDVDLCARLRRAGETIVYCPAARFTHSGAHSVSQLTFAERQLHWYANMLRYARKHFAGWQVLTLRLGIVVGMVMRSIASLFGGGPKGTPVGVALRAYARVAAFAMGFGADS